MTSDIRPALVSTSLANPLVVLFGFEFKTTTYTSDAARSSLASILRLPLKVGINQNYDIITTAP